MSAPSTNIEINCRGILEDLGYEIIAFAGIDRITVLKNNTERVVTMGNMDSYLPILQKYQMSLEIMAIDNDCKVIVAADSRDGILYAEHTSKFPTTSVVIAIGQMTTKLKYKGKK